MMRPRVAAVCPVLWLHSGASFTGDSSAQNSCTSSRLHVATACRTSRTHKRHFLVCQGLHQPEGASVLDQHSSESEHSSGGLYVHDST